MYFAFQNLRGLKGICRSASIFRVTSDDGTGAGQVASTTGSDALYRPDDEDSPEFQEYLKKLLQMQRNRAKTGFSAPSSRSTDAYFAKLNRIKLEKIARFRAGLPNDDIDVSYKPIDYEYAA